LIRVRSLATSCVLVLVAATGCASGGSVREGSTYVAMGDSYTAAAGVPEVVHAGCGRSSVNYPTLVAGELGLELTDVSCSGAATANLAAGQQTVTGVMPPQLDALTEDTDYVTIGIGGNDENFLGLLFTTCLSVRDPDPDGSLCRDAMNAGGTDVLKASVAVIQDQVTSALAEIRDRAPDARIVLVGYPQLVPADGSCDILPLTPDDADYFRGLMADLGAATEAAAAEAEVEYVDVLAASEGHDICAGEDAWVSGVVPTGRAATMHPFAEEQRAVADLVVEALKD
jgi:lysophospholipase L1-like esterase